MGWDRKKRGAAAGYFYESIRLPGAEGPIKVYRGRGAKGQLIAAAIAARVLACQRNRDAAQAEAVSTAELDSLAKELFTWADALTVTWHVVTGHHAHHGCWRKARA